MRVLPTALALFLPALAWGQGNSLSGDYARMMDWLSNEVVDPLAFNAGTTFDPPAELLPWDTQLDLSLGLGMLPLDTGKFPSLINKSLNDRNVGASFPQRIPFPDLSAHIRLALPRRWESAVRVSNVTSPEINVTPDTRAGAQANNVGFQLKRFFYGRQGAPKLAVSAHANYLWGRFTFKNSFKDVEMSTLTTDAENEGSMEWAIRSVGVNAVVSKTYGAWTPFGGVGVNLSDGKMTAKLRTEFDTELAAPSSASESARPRNSNVRLLFGTQLERRNRSDLYLSGEWLVASPEATSWNVHLGMVIPLRVGKTGSKEAKRPVLLDEKKPTKKLKDQNLIFIK